MTDRTDWTNKPALGSVFTKLAELVGRAERIRIARQNKAITRMAELLAQKDSE